MNIKKTKIEEECHPEGNSDITTVQMISTNNDRDIESDSTPVPNPALTLPVENDSTHYSTESVTPQQMDNDNSKLSKEEKKRIKREQKEEKRAEFWKQKREKQKQRTKERKMVDEEYKKNSWEKEAKKKELKLKWKNDQVKLSHPRIVVDLQWCPETAEKGNRKIFSQIAQLWGYQKKSDRPLTVHVTSYNEELLKNYYAKHNCDTWKQMQFHPENFVELFPKEDTIYLTPDSPNTLDTVDESKIYVIGGIVDGFNKSKNLSFTRASEQGIPTAKLPLDKSVRNPALNINHVANIITDFCFHQSWQSAFEKFVPKRYDANEPKKSKKKKPEDSDDINPNKQEIQEENNE